MTKINSSQIIFTIMLLIIGLGILLPLSPLVDSPMHHDEALYAKWAMLIAGGQDPMLNTAPVDKPPLFIYTVALFFSGLGVSDTAARLPSLAAHLIIISLTFALGQNLYNVWVALLAAMLVALSPYAILFAPTALTDPMMAAFALAAAVTAARKRPILAGGALALAAATKQQGVFFLPLVLALLALPNADGKGGPSAPPAPQGGEKSEQSSPLWGVRGAFLPIAQRTRHFLGKTWLYFFITFIVGLAIPLLWDLNRSRQPGFWLQSSLSYGPVSFGPAQFSDRLAGFVNLLGYAAASPILNLIFVIGLPVLLLSGPVKLLRTRRQIWADWILSGFCLAFVVLHALVTFQIWDRYLLGLIPLLALLLARILLLPLNFGEASEQVGRWAGRQVSGWAGKQVSKVRISGYLSGVVVLAAFALVVGLMAQPVRQATAGGYPIGGDHGAYYGALETAAYLRGHAGANVTLYHRWLGAHWRYYLSGFPYDMRFWKSADDLARQANANANGLQYIAFPPWQSSTPASLALSNEGLTLEPVFKTYQANGSPGLFLYQIVAE